MTPSPMRAENQRLASEMPASTHGQPGDDQRDPHDAAGGAVEAGDPVDDVAGQQRGDHADHRRGDHEQQEERQLPPVGPGDAEDPAHGALGQLPAGDRRVAPERPHRGHGGHRSGSRRAPPPSRRPANTHGGPACSGGSVSATSDELAQPAHLGGPLGGVLGLGVVVRRRSGSAPPSRGWHPTGGASERGHQVGDRARRGRPAGRRRWPARSARASAAPTARPVRQISSARE